MGIDSEPLAVDIIGDVHGCCEALERLLIKLGYQPGPQGYAHPEGRTVVFVGDLLDRGAHIRETVELVMTMYRHGNAQMVIGNHEYNALRHATGCREWIARGSSALLPPRLSVLMRETLEQFRGHLDQWEAMMAWLGQLPLFIDHEQFRVVHACWDQYLIDQYNERYESTALGDEFLQAATIPGSFEAKMVDRLTRGTSMPLPEGVSVASRDGYVRRQFRTKFWARAPKTYGDVVFQPDPLPYGLDEQPIHDDHHERLLYYSQQQLPVFFGHYWLSGRPKPLRKNIACLDYSAVNFGRMTAYRFDGEMQLSKDKFVWVYQEAHKVDETEFYDQDDLSGGGK